MPFRLNFSLIKHDGGTCLPTNRLIRKEHIMTRNETRFTLDGAEYQLACNNGENHLHGGWIGFSKKLWAITPVEGALI